MAHTNYFLDPSYWVLSSGNLQTNSLLSSETPVYLFNPNTINSNGFNKNSTDLTLGQFNAYKTSLTPPNGVIPSGADYSLSNWNAKGWGSSPSEVLTSYNTFITNNLVNSANKLAINPSSQDVTSYIISGNIGGTEYFVPVLAWANQSNGSVDLYDKIDELGAYLSGFRSEFKNPNFYEYWLDGNPFSITDGGSDMYDGGNYTYPWFLSNGARTQSSLFYSDYLYYSNTGGQIVDTDFKYVSLGYSPASGGYPPAFVGSGHPLTLIGTRNTVGSPIGFQKGGNSGADGFGALLSGFAYNGTAVNGFTTYAFIRETYNTSDPSHCDLYMLLGHPNWNSNFGTVNSFADPVSNGGNGGYLYTSGAGVKNILAVTMLLSKQNGVLVTTAECQTVVAAFTSRVKTFFGF